LYYNTTGSRNTGIGAASGRNPDNNIAQYRITTDNDMVLIGYGATKNNAAELTNGIAIGSGALVLQSNQAVLGNDSITTTLLKGSVGISTTSPWGQLSIEQLSGGLLDPVFVVADTGTTTPHFLVSQKGRVGIGTTTPATLIHGTDTGTSTLYLDSSGASTYGRIILEGKNACVEISVDAAGTGINTKSVSCPH